MRETGIFKYKANLYSYCQRYIVAFNNPDYSELVLHAPPLSYLSLFFYIIFLPLKMASLQTEFLNMFYSLFMFWLENIVLLILVFILEIVFVPFAYIKGCLTVLKNS